MKKELYIFGAGASYAAAQLPLGSELGWSYEMQCSTMFGFSNGSVSVEDVEEKKNDFVHFGDFLEIAGKIYPELSGEKEKWLKGMLEAMSYYPEFLTGGNKKYFTDEMLAIATKNKDREAIKIIRNVIYAHISEKCRDEGNDTLYDEFLEINKNANVSIISLNFDTLIKENYYNNRCIDYLINFDEYPDKRGYKKFKYCFPVIKLHGSIEWAWCSKCNKISLYGPWVTASTYNNRFCNSCNGTMAPFIVVPHEKTTHYPQWFNSLWDIAKKELYNSEIIYFVGYSIPNYDTDILSLLQNINKNAKIVVIDPDCENIKRKILQLGINSNCISTKAHGFSEYIKNIKIKTS